MILYHGTTSAALETICSKGILPRGKKGKTNWKDAPSRADCVYLTNAYPLYFAYSAVAVDSKERLLVVEADVNIMNLLPDEDWLEQVSRSEQGPAPYPSTMKARTAWYRRRLEKFQGHAMDSLKGMGNAAHLGPIPVGQLRRYALMEQEAYFELVMRGHDPLISVLNYRFVGDRYRQFVADLFDGKLEAEVHSF